MARQQSLLARLAEQVITGYLANEMSERTNIPGTGQDTADPVGVPTGGGGTDILGLGKVAWAFVFLLLAGPFICMIVGGICLIVGLFLPQIIRLLGSLIGAG